LALQCSPWGRLVGAGEQNSGEVRRGLAGEGWGGGLGLLGTGLGCWTGAGRLRRAARRRPGRDGRSGAGSGEVGRPAAQPREGGASMGYGVLASWNGDGIGGKVTFTEQPPWRPAAAWTSGGGRASRPGAVPPF
jgi:hypothetical protein